MNPFQAAVIGVSAGGLKALEKVLTKLSADFSLGVMVVQHTTADSDDFLARHLDRLCRVTVIQAEEKAAVKPGVVHLAPPNYHLLVELDLSLSLSVDAPVNFARPSIDVLFESAAEAYGKHLVGVILTGSNSDGSKGLLAVKNAGGLTLVQDPATAEASTMPASALKMVSPHHVLSLEKIGSFLENAGRSG